MIEGFISELKSTVRACIDCGALVAGGPTRCMRCAIEGAPLNKHVQPMPHLVTNKNQGSIKSIKKKSELSEAIQYTGLNIQEIASFVSCQLPFIKLIDDHVLKISTSKGFFLVFPGDYIIRDVKGKFYPCKSDIFLTCYDISE